MKRFGWVLLVLLAATPAWCAKKITVEQLKETLTSLQQAKKSDAEV
jgi:gamma-glutamylcysteine synthetase